MTSQNERLTQSELAYLRAKYPEGHELPIRRLTRHERNIEALIVASVFLGISALAGLLWLAWGM